MSRIGKLPIKIPESITIEKTDGKIKVSNKKNQELSVNILEGISIEINKDELKVILEGKNKQARSNWGTMRSLINNAVNGLTKRFQKTLLLEGVGYRINEQGDGLKLNLGYSHPIEYKKPENIEFEVKGNNQLIIKGFNKQQVGEIAAEIRSFRPVEPYKGKGFRYNDEIVRRKVGKKAAASE
jgi:large subunit ribosomal protein L6